MRGRSLLVVVGVWGLVFANATVGRSADSKPVDFVHEVVPILENRCIGCHADGVYEGGVSFDDRRALLRSLVVVPGRPEGSELIDRVTSSDPDYRMPPEGDPLSADEIDVLKHWIAQEVPWEPGFTFATADTFTRPPALREVAVPKTHAHPLDALLHAYYARNGIAAPEPCDDAVFLRRASLDLTGLLPTPEERDAFVNDTRPDRDARLVRRLLDDRRAYADHWLTYWNDLLRNDYAGTGYIDGGRKQITGWLYRSLLENKPFDEFVRELLAPKPEAEGFIRGIRWRGNVNASQSTELQFAQTTSQVFLGINMKCASCHDSFIDRWTLDDAYGLAAITADEPLEIFRCDKPTGRTAQAHYLFPELGDIDPHAPREERLAQFAALTTSPANGRFSRTIVNRLWHRLFGRGLVEPVDMMQNPAFDEDILDYLAGYLVAHDYDLKELLFHIATSQAYRATCDTRPAEARDDFRGPIPKRLTAEQFTDAVWSLADAAPAKPEAALPPEAPPARFVRASLVRADAMQRALGRPNREQVVSTRPSDLDTLQALELTNGPTFAALAARAGTRLTADHPSTRELVRHVYLATLCREPSADELAEATAFLGDTPQAEHVADLLWVILMQPEFFFVH
ncbi:hypothetical protein JCM19992_35280 [Thermostilla marina]